MGGQQNVLCMSDAVGDIWLVLCFSSLAMSLNTSVN